MNEEEARKIQSEAHIVKAETRKAHRDSIGRRTSKRERETADTE